MEARVLRKESATNPASTCHTASELGDPPAGTSINWFFGAGKRFHGDVRPFTLSVGITPSSGVFKMRPALVVGLTLLSILSRTYTKPTATNIPRSVPKDIFSTGRGR